ncbi:hypothetical protein AFFFEF_02992 [Methylorubrum extorquens]
MRKAPSRARISTFFVRDFQIILQHVNRFQPAFYRVEKQESGGVWIMRSLSLG